MPRSHGGAAQAAWRTTVVALLSTFLVLVGERTAIAQFPAKPVRMVVPFPPGAGTDVVARLVSQRLADRLGQPVVVENRVGAGGAIGTESVARAEPDGYTLLFVASPFTTVPVTTAKPAYDPVRQFAPVAAIAVGPLVWAVGPQSPATDMRGLVALARAEPGRLTYASAGPGSVNHLVLELFKFRTGTDIVHVPYKGMGPAIADLLGGQVTMLTTTVSGALPHLKQGKLRVLAVTSARRLRMLADVPTIEEAGVSGFDVNNYWGIVAPAGTPEAAIARINAEVARLLAAADFRERLDREGVEPMPGGPEAFGRFIQADFAAWRTLVQSGKLSFDQ